jgi:CubicO group peptidase (beta-lactamase class C family)
VAGALRERDGGATLALLSGAEVVTAAGVASAATGEPVTAATRFPIMSIAKAYTAAFVLRLAGEGRLALDDPLVRYLPELRLGGPWAGRTEGNEGGRCPGALAPGAERG